MPTLQIAGIRTVNQLGQNATLFQPYTDASALVLDLAASADLLALPSPSFQVVWQIIDPLTNQPVVNEVWSSTFNWGPYFWVSIGNNWGPNPGDYSTPQRWGLNWVRPGSGVFGVRGIAKAW